MIMCIQSLRTLLQTTYPKPAVEEVSTFNHSDGVGEPKMLRDTPSPAPQLDTPDSPLDSNLLLWDPTEDLRCLTRTFHQLHDSGWYWGPVSAGEAQALLRDELEGTFLVRDSCHPLYMLTLSLKTARGPTYVRIKYSHGHFCLDSSCQSKQSLPGFGSVGELVQSYARPRRPLSIGGHMAPPGLTLSDATVPLRLVRPLRIRETCPSLQHLARLAINRAAPAPAQLPLPRLLVQYLQDYPFQL
uniref:Cytokine inducible SH2 containing protein n=2 Tax=Paramormyrops kingsleyae TaxID=1676925 RepID=A0A3B3QPL3_9TELE|nr:cytokine-inducible SH2-containing protein-like isoform X1 [Paramormyrops kingsleyae]